MLKGTLLLGACGVLGTGFLLCYLKRTSPLRPALHYWFLGLAALFPTWLVTFMSLLPPLVPGAPPTPLPRPLIFSSGAVLLGIIFTHYLLRKLARSASEPAAIRCWLLGLAAFLPGWVIALWHLR